MVQRNFISSLMDNGRSAIFGTEFQPVYSVFVVRHVSMFVLSTAILEDTLMVRFIRTNWCCINHHCLEDMRNITEKCPMRHHYEVQAQKEAVQLKIPLHDYCIKHRQVIVLSVKGKHQFRKY